MYFIMNLLNGQPIIFEWENTNVIMYSVRAGRIYNHGIVFCDVLSDFYLSSKLQIICYQSLEHQIVVAQMNNLNIKETYVLKNKNTTDDLLENSHFTMIEYWDSLAIFYCCHNLKDSSFSLRVSKYTSYAKDCELLTTFHAIHSISVCPYRQNLLLILSYENNDCDLYFITPDLICKEFHMAANTTFSPDPSSSQNEQTKDNELQNLKHYYETQLYEKEKEFTELKKVHTSLSMQYNELSDYTGKLQEEIRTIRYHTS